MKKNINYLYFLFLVVFSITIGSCKKDKFVIPNQEESLFEKGGTITSYLVPDDPNASLKIGIGKTKVSSVDRQVVFSVTSPTGAVEGVQYSISSKTVTIPAGSVIDSVILKGLFSGFPTGRRDTLVFTITGGDIPNLIGSDVYKVVLQKFCPLVFSDFSGDFTVLEDGWEDYFPGDVVPLTISGNTILFNYATAYNVMPLAISIDPNTFATSVPLTAIGRYSPTGTNYTAVSVPGATSVAIPCDKIISINLKFGNTTSPGGSYGNFLLRLQKQ